MQTNDTNENQLENPYIWDFTIRFSQDREFQIKIIKMVIYIILILVGFLALFIGFYMQIIPTTPDSNYQLYRYYIRNKVLFSKLNDIIFAGGYITIAAGSLLAGLLDKDLDPRIRHTLVIFSGICILKLFL